MSIKRNNRMIQLLLILAATFTITLASTFIIQNVFETGTISDSVILSEKNSKNITGGIVKNNEKKWYDKDNPLQGAKYDGEVTNSSSGEISDWEIQFSIPENAYITDLWNGVYSVEDQTVTINSPKDYNLTIAPGETITFGFIMYAPKNYDPADIEFSYNQITDITHTWYYYTLRILSFISGIAIVVCIPFMLKIRELQKEEEESRKTIEQTLKLFANTIEAKDLYTSGHSARVSWYVRELAKKMGLSSKEQESVYYTAIIHDIGKIGIPDKILSKPGSLEKDEMDVMRKHAIKGGEILHGFNSLPDVADIVRHHHERYDGTGYPDGLAGNDIPLFSRIICIADCFDAMTSDRCYRKRLPIEKVVDELKENSGSQFDPDIVPYILDLIDSGVFPLKPDNKAE